MMVILQMRKLRPKKTRLLAQVLQLRNGHTRFELRNAVSKVYVLNQHRQIAFGHSSLLMRLNWTLYKNSIEINFILAVMKL